MSLRLILIWTLGTWLLTTTILSNANFLNEELTLNEETINKHLKHIIQQKNIAEKEQIIHTLQSILHEISAQKNSEIKIQKYQNIINNFSYMKLKLYENKNHETNQITNINNINNEQFSNHELNQHLLYANQQLITLNQKLQEEENQLQSVHNELILLPKQYAETKKILNIITEEIISAQKNKIPTSYLEHAKLIELKTKKTTKQLKITELELAQLSSNNRQELSKLHIKLLKNMCNNLDKEIQILHIKLNNVRQQEAIQTIEYIEVLTEKNKTLPQCIIQQIETNHNLSLTLKTQTQEIHAISLQEREINSHILKIRQTLTQLLEQAQWINKSSELGKTLRLQISNLPKINKIPKLQQINYEIAQIRGKKIQYENQIKQLSQISQQCINDNKRTLTSDQKKILNTQINIQKKILNSLLTNYDTYMLGLTKLTISYEQLKDSIQDINKATHRYLFWIPDINPINLSYPYEVYQDLHKLFTTKIIYQILFSLKLSLIKDIKNTLITNLFSILFLCSQAIIYQQYYVFLKTYNKKNNKNQYFNIIQNIFQCILISIPIPTLWNIIGCILSQKQTYPFAESIGVGIISTTPLLFIIIIVFHFTKTNKPFIIYFNWNKNKINKALHHYKLYSSIIIFLIITLISFNNYNNQELYQTLSRSNFILLCITLTIISKKLKQTKIILYTNKNNSSKNIINKLLWNILTYFPIIGILAASLGYLATAQTLLTHLEISIMIWIFLSIINHTIQYLIIIQKNYITNKSIKQQTIFPIINEPYTINPKKIFSQLETVNNINDNKNDSHAIKKHNNYLPQLIHYTTIFIAIISIIILCSEFHFIFEFLRNIILWNVHSTVQGIHNTQPITLETVLISMLILLITYKIIQNLPILLNIIILQYLRCSQNTHFIIITITKYIIILLSSIITCSIIGIEWSKLQWLIAAIGVGLGFGLQEIFANVISGLIILFEKPIRIGDTITIHNLTGKITHINTRATTMTNLDFKEIIIPNKEFITKKFVNWSLSNTITRVVLKIPAPSTSDTKQITQILLQAAQNCPLVLKNPQSEVYLIDIQQGIPIFEIRMYTAEIKHRMPLCHQVHILIIEYYKKYGLKLPFPHIQIYTNTDNTSSIYKTHFNDT